jgi:predicted nucleic acid-binding protein
VPGSLSAYDGSAGVLVDTNIWIDCTDAKSPWHDGSVGQLQICSERFPLHVNIVIYTELLVPGPSIEALDDMLDVYEVMRSPLPWSSAALAAKAFGMYRSRGGTQQLPLPDFFIGAHAAVANLSVLTRDPSGYSSYFARLKLIHPTRDA